MKIPSDAELLVQIEQFLRVSKMKPSRFGLETLSDGAVVFQLREGRRSLTLKSAQKVLQYIADAQAERGALEAVAGV